MSVEDLSTNNEKLRCQIEELRETVASLDAENRELLRENESIKDQNKALQTSADQFKDTIEDMQKKVEDIHERMDLTQKKIQELEVQNRSLMSANEELSKELHEVSCQMSLFREYKAAQEKDLLEMQHLSAEVKKYLKSLEERLDETEHHYHVKKSQSAQLREKVCSLLQLRENQRKDIKDLQAQLETCVQQATILRLDHENQVQMGSLMHEIVEAKLVDVALNQSRRRKVMQWVWSLGKVLVILVVGCSIILFLALSYTYFINQEFISETMLMFLNEKTIERIAQGFSRYLVWRNDGLLPF